MLQMAAQMGGAKEAKPKKVDHRTVSEHIENLSDGSTLCFDKLATPERVTYLTRIFTLMSLVVLAVLFCFLLLGSWKWEIVGIGTLFAMVYVGVTVRLINKHTQLNCMVRTRVIFLVENHLSTITNCH